MIGNHTNKQGRTLEGVMGDCKSLFQLLVYSIGCWLEAAERRDGGMEWMTEIDGHSCYRREVKSKVSGCVSFSSQPLSP